MRPPRRVNSAFPLGVRALRRQYVTAVAPICKLALIACRECCYLKLYIVYTYLHMVTPS